MQVEVIRGRLFAGEEGKSQSYVGCRVGVGFGDVQWDTTGDTRLTCRSVVGSHRAAGRGVGAPNGHPGGGRFAVQAYVVKGSLQVTDR